LKHLFRMAGFNQNFESLVADGQVYDLYYIKLNEINKAAYNFGDYVPQDSTVVIATISGGAFATALESVLEPGLGTVVDDSGVCVTTTSTTTVAPTTTTTTTT